MSEMAPIKGSSPLEDELTPPAPKLQFVKEGWALEVAPPVS